jgi:hypothetical protein
MHFPSRSHTGRAWGRGAKPIPEGESDPIIPMTGGSGYVGGRLIPVLERRGVRLRSQARNPEKLRPRVRAETEVVRGGVLDRSSLDVALLGIHHVVEAGDHLLWDVVFLGSGVVLILLGWATFRAARGDDASRTARSRLGRGCLR